MSSTNSENLGISLLDILSIISQYRKIVISSTFLTVMTAILISLSVTKLYQAEVLVVPATQKSSSMLDKYSGIAGLAGINISSGADQIKEEALSVLRSRKFIKEFVSQHQLKKVLFREMWNSDTQAWKTESFNPIKSIKGLFGSNDGGNSKKGLLPGEPSEWEVYNFFISILGVNENRLSSTISISIELPNPEEASKIANDIVSFINNTLRQENNQRAEKSVEYLQQQLRTIQIVELRSVIIKIIGEYLSNIAVSSAEDAYAFKVIDPAIAPEERSYPNRIFMVLLGGVLGFVFGTIGAFILSIRKDAIIK